MKIVNCTWELANIEKKTCEITIEDDEISLDIVSLAEIESQYEYIVVKVGSKKVPIYKKLASNGFYFVENQISVSFRSKQKGSMGRMANKYFDRLNLRLCPKENIQIILGEIGDDLFYTDRIALDPAFGIIKANKRYKNWINSTYDNQDFFMYEICLLNKAIGFAYFQKRNNVIDYLLGGLYKEYQSSGLGITIPLSAIKLLQQENMKSIETCISSNNLNVVRCYVECGYEISGMNYVFVKVK